MSEAQQEAERRYPHRNVFLEGAAYMAEERSRVPLRNAFVAGAEWQASRAPQPTEAEWSCEQGCKAPSAVCLLDHRPAPQPPEDDREALALVISEARGSQMMTEFDRGIADAIFDWMREQGFRRAPAEPAVTGTWAVSHVSDCAADLRDAIAEHERAARANGREDADDMTDERERVAGMEVADAARALLAAIGEDAQ